MYIRQATTDDNEELQTLQARCPVGTTLIVSTVNTPDFFARAKAYESYKVFVACEDNRIVGSAACAVRKAIVNSNTCQVGYEFQYFTSPDLRKKGIAGQLHQHIEHYFVQSGVALSYLIVIEGNIPAIRVFEGQGFSLCRTLIMPALLVFKQKSVPDTGKVRPITPEDFPAVADLLNETWQGHQLYEPTSPDALAQFIHRMPVFAFENLLVLEYQGKIVACIAYWDWHRITRVTVESLSPKMQRIALLMNAANVFRLTPKPPKPGDVLKQMVLTTIGFKDPALFAVLIRYMHNRALRTGIEQIFCVCEQGHKMLSGLKGIFRIDTKVYLYVKPLQPNEALSDKPVFIDGIDL